MEAIIKENQPSFKIKNRILKKGDMIEIEEMEYKHSLGIDKDKPCVYSKIYKVVDESFYLPIEDLEII